MAHIMDVKIIVLTYFFVAEITKGRLFSVNGFFMKSPYNWISLNPEFERKDAKVFDKIGVSVTLFIIV